MYSCSLSVHIGDKCIQLKSYSGEPRLLFRKSRGGTCDSGLEAPRREHRVPMLGTMFSKGKLGFLYDFRV